MISMKQEQIAVIGGGNWGTAIAKHLAENVLRRTDTQFARQVNLWVYEEILESGELLTETINTMNENVKYLPFVSLPKTIVASSSLEQVITQSSVLVIAVPDEFLERVVQQIKEIIPKKKQKHYKIISLTKGIISKKDSFLTPTEVIAATLRYPKRKIACLSGGNIATEVAQGHYVESIIGCKNRKRAHFFKQLFSSEQYKLFTSRKRRSIELLGALKNIVALTHGFSEGLRFASSTKYAILRKSIQEMMRLGKVLDKRFDKRLLFSPAGLSDILVTAESGRNSRFAKKYIQQNRTEKNQSKEYIEQKYFNGQKIQGVHTLGQIQSIILDPKSPYPVFCSLYKILFSTKPVLDFISPEPTKKETK